MQTYLHVYQFEYTSKKNELVLKLMQDLSLSLSGTSLKFIQSIAFQTHENERWNFKKWLVKMSAALSFMHNLLNSYAMIIYLSNCNGNVFTDVTSITEDWHKFFSNIERTNDRDVCNVLAIRWNIKWKEYINEIALVFVFNRARACLHRLC